MFNTSSFFFRLRKKITLCLRSNIVYKFVCGRCNATYYSEICRHLKVRVGEHSDISRFTDKRSKSKNSAADKVNMLMCNHIFSFEEFEVLASKKIKKILLISRKQPMLNKNRASLRSYLFD